MYVCRVYLFCLLLIPFNSHGGGSVSLAMKPVCSVYWLCVTHCIDVVRWCIFSCAKDLNHTMGWSLWECVGMRSVWQCVCASLAACLPNTYCLLFFAFLSTSCMKHIQNLVCIFTDLNINKYQHTAPTNIYFFFHYEHAIFAACSCYFLFYIFHLARLVWFLFFAYVDAHGDFFYRFSC